MKKLFSVAGIVAGIIIVAALFYCAKIDDNVLYGDGYDPDYGV